MQIITARTSECTAQKPHRKEFNEWINANQGKRKNTTQTWQTPSQGDLESTIGKLESAQTKQSNPMRRKSVQGGVFVIAQV